MVLGVCRRAPGDAHRAEDVARAMFLVLAREPDRIARPHALAAWLHRTARHLLPPPPPGASASPAASPWTTARS
jgi:DNA-directed RNA polymerase specialized sigma24 family protein